MAAYGKFQVNRNKFKNPNMFDKAKSNKKELPELTKSERLVEGVEIWAGFYRCNLHRFVKDYFDINLKLFQKILIFMMAICVNFIYLASRRQGKTWLLGVFCSAMATLYPGIKIIVAAGTKSQGIQVINKIGELRNDSPNLAREIKYYSNNVNNPVVEWHNGSTVKAVASTDGARGNMAHIIIYDEYRMIKKNIVDTVLKKFRGSERMPKFYSKPEYNEYPKERNKQIFLSSAFYKFHWMWNHLNGYLSNMLDDTKRYFCCGLPYQLSIKEGLLSREQVLEDMSEEDFSEVGWLMECECLFFGEGENAFFNYESLDDNRKIKYPIYPRPYYALVDDNKNLKYKIKENGEIRFVVADIATMGGSRNDLSAYIIFQLIPAGNNQYIRNIVYMESMSGGHTVDQSIRIRQLFDDFDCDYIVLDTANAGIGIYDNLVQDLIDKDRFIGDKNIEYPAMTCMNDDKMAERCKSLDAQPLIYSVKGHTSFNNECAVSLRDGLKRNKVRLLVQENEGKEWLYSNKQFVDLSVEEQVLFEAPYFQVSEMINEMVNLGYERTEGGQIKLKEPANMRKDRYSALSYGNYFANVLESDLRVKTSQYEYVCFYN